MMDPFDDPSPTPSAAPRVFNVVMKEIIQQSLKYLPAEYLGRFRAAGEKILSGKPLTVTTLCSGTDGAIDALKDWKLTKQWNYKL